MFPSILQFGSESKVVDFLQCPVITISTGISSYPLERLLWCPSTRPQTFLNGIWQCGGWLPPATWQIPFWYSVPQNQLAEVRARIQTSEKAAQVKKEAQPSDSPVAIHPQFIDLTEDKEDRPTPRSDTDLAIMSSLGITKSQDDFFSSTIRFINSRTGDAEPSKEVFYRHEIWQWMEQSLAKGFTSGWSVPSSLYLISTDSTTRWFR